MLASASQDKYLRVWRIQPEASKSASSGDANASTQDLAAAIARRVCIPTSITMQSHISWMASVAASLLHVCCLHCLAHTMLGLCQVSLLIVPAAAVQHRLQLRYYISMCEQ